MSDLQEDKSDLACQTAGENPRSKMVEDESKSASELLSKKSGSETATSKNTAVLSTKKDSESVVSVKQAIKEGSKVSLAEDLDTKRDSSVKSGSECLASGPFASSKTTSEKETDKIILIQESEIFTRYLDNRIKLNKSSTIQSSLDVGKKTAKDSRAENRERAESSNLSTSVDSDEKTNESSKTLEKMHVVNDSNKAEREGDGKMSDTPMINITLSEGKSQSKLQNTGKVSNSDFQKGAAEILLPNLSAAADITDNKLAEDKELSEVSIPSKVNMPVRSPTQIKIDFFRELEGSGRCVSPPLMSPRKLFPRNKPPSVDEKSPNETISETAKVKKSESDIVSAPQSSATCGSDVTSNKLFPRSKSPSAVEKSPKKTTPETAPVKQRESDIVSVSQSSVSCGLDVTSNKLFPRSKSPSAVEKSPKKTTPGTAPVKQRESDIASVSQSSVSCSSDIMTNKPLRNQHVKCEIQVAKPVKEIEESIKTRTQSKRCIEISAPKRQAKRTDPTIIATGTKFRILFDVSLFEKESLSVHIIGDKIDVYCKQVNENEFGEELHEIHQVFRIPAYVDVTCLTASITEDDMLLLDAPFEIE